MKLFECIVDDGENVSKVILTAKNRKALIEQYGFNGEFVKVKDITADYFTAQSVDLLDNHLMRMGWGRAERKIICALLEAHLRETKKI